MQFNNGTLVDQLPLLTRTRNALIASNVLTLGDLCGVTERELLRMPNFGRISMRDVHETLGAMGRELRDPWPAPPRLPTRLERRIRKIVRDELRAHGLINGREEEQG